MAARAAISSPLLDLSIDGAAGVLFNITGGNDMTMFEVDEAARIISSSVDPDANIIFGAVVREEMSDQIKITVIATGFDETRARLAQFSKPAREEALMQGVVSEKPEGEKEDEEGKKEEIKADEDYGDDDETPPEEPPEDDVFGEKFEIPAFLRKPS
jgi:cell division protein FtsZ